MFGPNEQSAVERLRDYLGQLPPKAQALLMREFERRGSNAARNLAGVRISCSRNCARSSAPSEDAAPRSNDRCGSPSIRSIPFLVDNVPVLPCGGPARSAAPRWRRSGSGSAPEGCPDAVRALEARWRPRSRAPRYIEAATRTCRSQRPRRSPAVAGAVSAGERQRSLGRIGAPRRGGGLGAIGAVLAAREGAGQVATSSPDNSGPSPIPRSGR